MLDYLQCCLFVNKVTMLLLICLQTTTLPTSRAGLRSTRLTGRPGRCSTGFTTSRSRTTPTSTNLSLEARSVVRALVSDGCWPWGIVIVGVGGETHPLYFSNFSRKKKNTPWNLDKMLVCKGLDSLFDAIVLFGRGMLTCKKSGHQKPINVPPLDTVLNVTSRKESVSFIWVLPSRCQACENVPNYVPTLDAFWEGSFRNVLT